MGILEEGLFRGFSHEACSKGRTQEISAESAHAPQGFHPLPIVTRTTVLGHTYFTLKGKMPDNAAHH